jgi:2-keto-4-pentenoate hydratase
MPCAPEAVVLLVNGSEIARGTGAAALGHPLEAVTWLANLLARRGDGLRARELVSTGSCTGLQKARAGDEVVARFGALGEARVRLRPI